jgi:cobalamin-dependent methionine synthase I
MMILIGESINGSIPKVGQAILERDETHLRELATLQYGCGAHFLDVNAGVAGGNEIEDLAWLVDLVQREVPLPLMIDSADPEALKTALLMYRHSNSPILNSISGEEQKWNKLYPVIVEKKCRVVILCMDDQGIPKTTQKRVDIATKLFERLTHANIPSDYIYFDPLVLSIGVEPEAAIVTLETIRMIRTKFPESHTLCGVSNVSMGLPGRRLINRSFIAMAIAAGLDSLCLDVRDQSLLASIYASKVLANQDLYCQEYLQAYRTKKILL